VYDLTSALVEASGAGCGRELPVAAAPPRHGLEVIVKESTVGDKIARRSGSAPTEGTSELALEGG